MTGAGGRDAGYGFFVAGSWEPRGLVPLLADCFRVRPQEVSVALDESAAGAETRNWAALVFCDAQPVTGDVSWALDLYAHGGAELPDSRTLALRLAAGTGRVVLYSAPLVRPCAYWMATPGGRVGRAVLEESDDGLLGAYRLAAVELMTPQLPLADVSFVYAMIGDEVDCHPLAQALRAIADALRECCPEGFLELRGSLAAGTADRHSDIDLCWTVPGERFAAAVAGAAPCLERAHPLLTARSDPAFHAAAGRRLLTYFFRDLPLFWRLDLDVRAGSPPPGPAPAGGDWPPAVSALANAVGAAKALRRGRPAETVRGLLDRGFARIGAPERATGHWARDIQRLAAAAERVGAGAQDAGAEAGAGAGAGAGADPAVRALADRVRLLAATTGLP